MVLIYIKHDLLERLIRFTGIYIRVKNTLVKNYEVEHLAKKLIRS